MYMERPPTNVTLQNLLSVAILGIKDHMSFLIIFYGLVDGYENFEDC